MKRQFARHEWMGKKVKVHFARHWPVKLGNYTYDGFDDRGIWVTHAENGQRHIMWYDIESVVPGDQE